MVLWTWSLVVLTTLKPEWQSTKLAMNLDKLGLKVESQKMQCKLSLL
jgi:hypothetical protein